jgi:hypothetical protein
LTIDFRAPQFACDACEADTLEIPQWTDEQSTLNCQICGKPVGVIGDVLETLRTAAADNENPPPAEEDASAVDRRLPRYLN